MADQQHRYDTSTHRRLGAVRMVVAWLSMLLIAFNVLGGAVFSARAEATPLSFAHGPDQIEICTATGIVVMDLDGNIIPVGESQRHNPLCAFCLPLAHGGVDLPEGADILVQVSRLATATDFPRSATSSRQALTVRSAAPRAPPFS